MSEKASGSVLSNSAHYDVRKDLSWFIGLSGNDK